MKKPASEYPSISVVMPTLNAASVIEECLDSVVNQDYPKDKIEIVIGDGGSTDKTVEIAKKYGARVYKNKLVTSESGKAVAFHHAKNELVALIDSDNILPGKDWFKKMVAPFADKEVIGSEPWEYTLRKKDGFIDRYCALMGVNDPLCYFLGNYDRLNILSGKWTGLPVQQEDQGGWIKVGLKVPVIPTIGANGAMFRREFLETSGLVGDYLFDIDIISQAATSSVIYFAKVKTGTIHTYCGTDINKFIRKQRRRIKDYLYHQKVGDRFYPWRCQSKVGVLKFAFACLAVFPLVFQAAKGYLKKNDRAWLFHLPACLITFWVYSLEAMMGIFHQEEMSRKGWRQ